MPQQLGLDRLEEGLDGRVVVAVSLAAHGHLEPVLAQNFLIVTRTILAATIRMVNAALRRLPQGNGHVQGPDRQVMLHPVAHRPADHTPRMEVQDDGQVEPALAGPDVA